MIIRCLFAAALACSTAVAADAPRRNVLLIIADDLGPDAGCYGGWIKTPHIDALAAGGVRFTHAFATTASCSASRAVLLTGLYTHSNGQFGHAHQPHNFHTHSWIKSLPAQLKTAGWRTGIVGKLHVQPAGVYPWDADMTNGNEGNRGVAGMADRARTFVNASDKPFFLVVGFADPHRGGKGFANDKTYKGVPDFAFDPKDVRVPEFLPDLPAVREELADYARAVMRMDHGVGLLSKMLGETGRDKDTLVIFLSDNGIPFPGAKTTAYDSGLRLPLIVSRGPGGPSGVTNSAMVNWVDIVPTVLDWAGVKPAQPLPGRSLLPILDKAAPEGWDQVFASHVFHEVTNYYPMRVVRTRKYKLILNLAHGLEFPFASDLLASRTWQAVLDGKVQKLGVRDRATYLNRPAEELYDIEADPLETRNLAGDAKYAEVLSDLRGRLKTWRAATKDPWHE